MPKAEKGSVKDLGNRMKAKGLQKLKFYCQMCEKQCRDANGFKCHLTSESHLRQMKIFSDNAGGILEKYSKEFERSYISTLRMRHGTKQVNANNVYQELIADKQHIHMNATHWATLSDFVQYLGKTGKCVVNETERGWMISYIERDAAILARMEATQRREESEKALEEAQLHRMEIQRVEAAKALDRAGGTVHTEATKLERTDDTHKPIKVALGGVPKKSLTTANVASIFGGEGVDEDEEDEEKAPTFAFALAPPASHRNVDAVSAGNKRNEPTQGEAAVGASKKKQKTGETDKYRKSYWLYRNIIVRIISKSLSDGKYFKRKAVVEKVIDKYMAEVEVLDSGPDQRDGGDILRLDQDDLETVIPKEVGTKVRVLNGKYRGDKALVEELNKSTYHATLRLMDDDQILEGVPYEDFSKLA
jgi:DNA/RNA-binding protein KIN17